MFSFLGTIRLDILILCVSYPEILFRTQALKIGDAQEGSPEELNNNFAVTEAWATEVSHAKWLYTHYHKNQ